MTRREIWLIAAVALLLGLIGGLLIGSAFSDDDTEAGDGTATTVASTTEAPATTQAPPTTEAPVPADPGTTSTTSTTSTTTTPAPTTSAAAPPPLADAVTGEVLGFAIGSELDTVIAAMTDRYGEPTIDFGWTTGCVLDGDPDLDERVIRWGNFVLRGWKDDAMAVLDGWRYFRGAAGEFDETGPRPDELVLHDGVEWNMTIGAVATALGTEFQALDDFGFSHTVVGEYTEYRGVDTSPDSFFNYVGYRPGDICE